MKKGSLEIKRNIYSICLKDRFQAAKMTNHYETVRYVRCRDMRMN